MSLESDIARALAVLKAQSKPVRHIIVQRPKKPRGGKARHATGPRGGATEIQTLLFPRPQWTEGRAKSWAQANGKRYGDVDVTERFIRLRQAEPGKFKRLRMITLKWDGRQAAIKAVVGVR